MRANDDLLAHFGGRWDSPPEFPAQWLNDPAATEFVTTERAALSALFASDRYLPGKDPRISLASATALASSDQRSRLRGGDRA